MSHPGDLLSAYVDGELGEDERGVVERHLLACEACRGEFAAITYSRDSVRALPVEAEHRPAAQTARPRWQRRWLPAAAAAVLALFIGAAAIDTQDTPLPFEQVVDQHSARASLDPGSNVLQVRAVFTP